MTHAEKTGIRCTVTTTTLVQIYIRGEGGDFPRCPDDGGLILRFLRWCDAQGIYPAVRGGTTGGGVHVMYYHPDDAARILVWLTQQGIELVDEHPAHRARREREEAAVDCEMCHGSGVVPGEGGMGRRCQICDGSGRSS